MYTYKLFVIFFLFAENQYIDLCLCVYKLNTCIITFLSFFLFEKNISHIFAPVSMRKL